MAAPIEATFDNWSPPIVYRSVLYIERNNAMEMEREIETFAPSAPPLFVRPFLLPFSLLFSARVCLTFESVKKKKKKIVATKMALRLSAQRIIFIVACK